MSQIAPKPGTLPGTAAGCARRRRTRRRRVAQAAAHNGYAAGPRNRACPRCAHRSGRSAQGYWLFELEADCTIPAEYIMMMHFLDEIDAALETKICRHLRSAQAEHGGWPLYHGGDFNLSCSVKAYYALKLAGDSPSAPHMARARAAILQHGGAARANVFTRIALALFAQIPWRGVPLHSGRNHVASAMVSVPSRQGGVLVAHRHGPVVHFVHAQARGQESAQCAHSRVVHHAARRGARLLPAQGSPGQGVSGGGSTGALDRSLDSGAHARTRDPPGRGVDARAAQRRRRSRGHLSGHGQCLGGHGHSRLCRRRSAACHRKRALQKLLVVGPSSAYCQPCVSPIWDTALAAFSPCKRSATRARPRRRFGRSTGCKRGNCWTNPGTGGWIARNLPAAVGRFSLRTATTPISMIRRRSSGRCIRRASRIAMPRACVAHWIGWWECRARTAVSLLSMPTTPATTST